MGSAEYFHHTGGREFIVPNLPPLGEAAFFRGLGIPALSAAADQWTAAFDAELAADISNFKSDHPDAIVVSLDVAGLYQQIIQPSNPFGFVNTTDAVGPLVPGSVFLAAVTATDPQDYLFYDGVHPTSKAHQLLGMQAAAELLNALPGHHLLIGSQQIGANVAGKAGDSSANAATMLGSKGTLLVAGADYTVLNDSDTVAGLIKPRTSIAIVGGDELFAWDTAKVAFEVL